MTHANDILISDELLYHMRSIPGCAGLVGASGIHDVRMLVGLWQ